MDIRFKTPEGQTLMAREIDADKVDAKMEELLKLFQQDGLYVNKIAPGLFDISRRDSKDVLHRLGSLVIE